MGQERKPNLLEQLELRMELQKAASEGACVIFLDDENDELEAPETGKKDLNEKLELRG